MDPITLGVIGGSAIANFGLAIWKGEQDVEAALAAGQITKAQAQQLQAAFEKMKAGWELPPGQAPQLSPVELELVGQFQPELYKHTLEKAPQLVPQGGLGRDSQLRALDKFGQMAETGTDAISTAAQADAQFKAQADNRLRQQEILANFANRGLLTGSSGIAAQLAAAQQAGGQQEQLALQAAAEAQRRRMEALSGYSNLAGQVRQADTSVEQANATIMNAFNERMANSMNDYNRYITAKQNDAALRNLDARQRISDFNRTSAVETANTNAINQFNAEQARRDEKNKLSQMEYDTTKDAVAIRTGGQLTQNRDITNARTGMMGNAAGALNQAGGQFMAANSAAQQNDRFDKWLKFKNQPKQADEFESPLLKTPRSKIDEESDAYYKFMTSK